MKRLKLPVVPELRRIFGEEDGYVSQSEHIISKFGGIDRLEALLKEIGTPKHKTTINRWLYPKGRSSGTGGVIPTKAWPDIIRAARLDGILLTPDDFFPLPRKRRWTKRFGNEAK